MTSIEKQLAVRFLTFVTGLNIAFLFFSATYVAFSGHFIEAIFYAAGVLASVHLIKHPLFVRQGLSFGQPLAA